MNYPHMCRMDHDDIGYRGDGERCPVCVVKDELAARDRELAEAERIIRGLVSGKSVTLTAQTWLARRTPTPTPTTGL